MRRKDREITDRAEIEAILNEAPVCRIGLAEGGEPYIVPMCFGYDGTFLYLHSAPEASKNLSGSSPVSSLSGSGGEKNLSGSSRVSSLSGSGGKKITMIRKNPRCCFEVDICDRIVRADRPCSWGMRYRSVIGFGRADILEDPEEKRHGLNRIMLHYGGETFEFPERDLVSVTVIRIAIESMTGKKHD
jgi:nitroimidazol reductase NimA-like FMN-containing flavoprotein (pyridoxamine 5'-phosphate oxidase superfamily)